ncbi:hypothetical protein [Streptomyces tubercidicus]
MNKANSWDTSGPVTTGGGERYGLTMQDLNLDLGPLGSLLPRDDAA